MTQAIAHRKFEPGTTGWTVHDLDDPQIFWEWSEGRHEIVEGVLTTMAPQGFETVDPLEELRRFLERHLDATGQKGRFYREVDLLLKDDRVARPDLLFLTPQQRREQKRISRERGLPVKQYHPVYVTPMFVIESLSVGHENHDRVTKRAWYAQAGIRHYWLLTPHERSLVCLTLRGSKYVEEAAGEDNQTIVTKLFGGVKIPLAKIWDD